MLDVSNDIRFKTLYGNYVEMPRYWFILPSISGVIWEVATRANV